MYRQTQIQHTFAGEVDKKSHLQIFDYISHSRICEFSDEKITRATYIEIIDDGVIFIVLPASR